MSTDFSAWLDERLAVGPPALAAAIREAVAGGPPTPRTLTEAAERLMRASRVSATARPGALTLLAADALTTLAYEWGAAHGSTRSR